MRHLSVSQTTSMQPLHSTLWAKRPVQPPAAAGPWLPMRTDQHLWQALTVGQRTTSALVSCSKTAPLCRQYGAPLSSLHVCRRAPCAHCVLVATTLVRCNAAHHHANALSCNRDILVRIVQLSSCVYFVDCNCQFLIICGRILSGTNMLLQLYKILVFASNTAEYVWCFHTQQHNMRADLLTASCTAARMPCCGI